MKITVFDTTGKKKSDLELNTKDFGTKINEPLLAQAIRIYEYNSHQRTSKAKTRGEITGSTRKIYRQKGTGRARHGDNYAPIFVGGGVSHGPVGLKGKNLILPKKMKRKALASSLLARMTDNALSLLDSFDKFPAKTKDATSLLIKIANYPKNKILIITNDKSAPLYLSTKNLQNVTIRRSELVNPYDVIYHDFILISQDALTTLKSRILGTYNSTLKSDTPEAKKTDTPTPKPSTPKPAPKSSPKTSEASESKKPTKPTKTTKTTKPAPKSTKKTKKEVKK